MEQFTPKAIFDLFILLSHESQTTFLKLLAGSSLAEVPLIIAANLSEVERRRFGQIEFTHAVDMMMPFLLTKAVELARDHPKVSDQRLLELLSERVKTFAEDFARQASEMERRKLKDKRDRKSDPATIRRNVEICDRRKRDRKKWSLGMLAKHFKISIRAVTLVISAEIEWRSKAALLRSK